MFGFTGIIYLDALPVFLSRQSSEYLSLYASHYDNLTLLYSFLTSLCRLNVWLYLNYLPLQISPFFNLTVFRIFIFYTSPILITRHLSNFLRSLVVSVSKFPRGDFG